MPATPPRKPRGPDVKHLRGTDYVTATEAARRLGCSHPTIHDRIRTGEIPALRIISGPSVIYAIRWKDVRNFAPRSYLFHA